MLDMTIVGATITRLRKEKNLTQMELADLMKVSHQAVSNWERGETMPDISKLPELATILGVSIDSLLGCEVGAELIKSAAENRMGEYVAGHEVTVAEFKNAAPLLKPDQIEYILKAIKKVDSIEDLLDILAMSGDMKKNDPGVSESAEENESEAQACADEDELAEEDEPAPPPKTPEQERQDAEAREAIARGESIDALMRRLPYVSREVADEIAYHTLSRGSTWQRSYTPYVSRRAADAVALHGLSAGIALNNVIDIIPFVSRATAEKIAGRAVETFSTRVTPFLPYVGRETTDKIARCALARHEQDTSKLRRCMYYTSIEVSDEIARDLLSRGRGYLEDLAPFISRDTKRLFLEARPGDYGLLLRFVGIEKFFESEYFDSVVESMMEKRENPDKLFMFLPFVSPEAAERAAGYAMSRGGGRVYKFMPYVGKVCADSLALYSMQRRDSIDRLAWNLPLFSRTTCERLAREIVARNHGAFVDYAGFVSAATRDELAQMAYAFNSNGRGSGSRGNRNNFNMPGGFPFNADSIREFVRQVSSPANMGFQQNLKEELRRELRSELREELRTVLREELKNIYKPDAAGEHNK